jgi:hypothetical protein
MNNVKLFFANKNTSKVTLPGKAMYDFPDEVYINTFTLEDLYQITTIGIQGDEKRLIQFMQSHLSVDVSKLTETDFKYLLFWERLNSYSYNPITLSWECIKCLKDNKTEINETNLDYKELSSDYTKNGLIIELYSGEKIIWRIPTIQDTNIVKEFCKGKDPYVYALAEIAQCITFHNNPEIVSLKDKLEKVKSFLPDDFSIFTHLNVEYTNYGIQDKANVVCSHCQARQDVEFQFGITNIFPSFPSSGSLRSRILPNNSPNESKSTSNTRRGVQQTSISKEEVRGEIEIGGTSEEQQEEKGEVNYQNFVENTQ